ncbi:MAG: hypothetical protein ABIU95_09800 [Burkholderiales bacterium]
MFKSYTRRVAHLLAGALVFAQLAVAAYACPKMSASATAITAFAAESTSADTPMVAGPCEGIDPAAPNLCYEHCHFGQQTVDHPQPPTVPPAAPAVRAVFPLDPSVTLRRTGTDVPWRASASPPLAILHCCFRI